MVSLAKGTGDVGYNVHVVVDTKLHLIVAHEVTNVGNDRAQLSKMAIAAMDRRPALTSQWRSATVDLHRLVKVPFARFGGGNRKSGLGALLALPGGARCRLER
jgi:hypothetical protein